MQLSIAHFVVGFEAVPHSLVQVGFKHVAEARLEFPFLLFLLAEG